MQINSAGDNPHRLPDSSLRRLAADLDNLPFDVEKIFSLVGRAFSPDDRRRFQMKLSGVSAALARLSAVGIPDSLCHGDIRPGNMRMIGNVPVLYDWGMAFYGFPFYDALHFLRVLHRSLTPPQTEQLKLAYLSPWQRRFPRDRLQEAWELGPSCCKRTVVGFWGYWRPVAASRRMGLWMAMPSPAVCVLLRRYFTGFSLRKCVR